MKWRRAIVVVAIIVLTAAMQTTVFVRLRLFGAAPQLGVLVVIAMSRNLEPIESLLYGFGTGLLLDLLAETPLGLWALVCAAVAYTTVRLRRRLEDEVTLLGPAVFVFTFGALALFAILSTIFGQKTFSNAGWVGFMMLPALYNSLLAVLVLPLITRLIPGAGRRYDTVRWDL